VALGEWFSGVGRIPCAKCEEVHLAIKKEPPCETCFPGVHRWNTAAVAVYKECENQYVEINGHIVGLSLEAFEIACEWHGIIEEERQEIWTKVKVIVGTLIAQCVEKAEEEKRLRKLEGK
jgi:hypothetical protein